MYGCKESSDGRVIMPLTSKQLAVRKLNSAGDKLRRCYTLTDFKVEASKDSYGKKGRRLELLVKSKAHGQKPHAFTARTKKLVTEGGSRNMTKFRCSLVIEGRLREAHGYWAKSINSGMLFI